MPYALPLEDISHRQTIENVHHERVQYKTHKSFSFGKIFDIDRTDMFASSHDTLR